jgi:hypothetical protein
MAIESFSFDKGMNRRKSPLFLTEGEVYTCKGFGFLRDGVLEARTALTIGEAIDSTATSKINAIHRYGSNVYASSKKLCPGGQAYFNYIYHKWYVADTFENIDILSGNTRPRMVDYQEFIFMVDGSTNKVFNGESFYEWGFDAPLHTPRLTAGAAGNPSGTYSCYVTFYMIFPNGNAVETAPSPVGSVTVTAQKIEWSGIPIAPNFGYGTTYRKLYREVSGIIYLVTTIEDNYTTSYSDNVLDATLQLNAIMTSDDYVILPLGVVDICLYLQRIFAIKDNKLYWTEPYMPFSLKLDSNVSVSKDDEDLVSVVDWGDQLYMGNAETWFRLQGNDPDTWSIRRTFAEMGVINKHTVKKTKYGILGLWNDGIYLFDGSTSKNITEKILGREIFTDLTDLSVCYAEWDGTKYKFHYASTGTTLDSCLVLDFSLCPPINEMRIYEDDFLADAEEVYKETNHRYVAKGGYEYSEGGTETIATSLVTGDKAFQAILKRKCLDYLYYDINTNGENVTVGILVDGVIVQTLTLNETSRVRKRSDKLMAKEGYRFTLQITCADSQSLEIYSPWALEATPVGD